MRMATDPIVTEELTIVGVFRVDVASEDDPRRWREWWVTNVDVVIPARTAEELCFRMPSVQKSGRGEVTVEVDETDHVKEVNEKIKQMGLDSYCLVEAVEREQFMYLMIFTGMTCIAVVALVVAALGIINTMLMSVLERTREIGVMKAVGARDRHIRLIFLVEGALIGLVGGLFGLLLSWVASIPGDAWVRSLVAARLNIRLQDSIFAFPLWLVVGVPLFAAVITTLAAVYPAHRAARVNPITTLRHE